MARQHEGFGMDGNTGGTALTQKHRELIEAARAATAQAYARYSGFRVGAALLSEQGNVYTGCNVENVSYPVGVCAERNAIGAAVRAEGPGLRVAAVAVVAFNRRDEPSACSPCGECRQAIREFSGSAEVIYMGREGDMTVRTIAELLPDAFGSG
nr:cytidine deaminase [Ferruginivarius sediminum]